MNLRRVRFGLLALTGVLVLGLFSAGPLDAASSAAQTGEGTAGTAASAASTASTGSTASAASADAAGRYIVTLRGLAPAAGAGRSSAAESQAAAAAARTAEVARVARVDRNIASVAQRYRISVGTTYHYALQGFAASLSGAQVAALRADPEVLSITPVQPVYLADAAVPDGVERVGASPPPSGPVPPNLGQVNVAVLDTGIRYIPNDPELKVASRGIDCSGDAHAGGTTHTAWADIDTGSGHGTHVSGTIGARANVPGGIVGVAPGVRLFAVRIFKEQDGGVVGSTETVACGVDWVASTRMADPPVGSRPIDVANMSIQGPPVSDSTSCPTPASSDAELAAICAATALGVTFVVAAGNSSRDAATSVPAAYDSVITVSALSDYDGKPGALDTSGGCGSGDPDDSFASYSNYGAPIDLIAPGTCITSLGRTNGTTHAMSGTSMATPHVTGAAARYVAMLFAQGKTRSEISVDVIKEGLRAAGNFDWTTASDPDGNPDRLLDVAALQATSPKVNVWAFPALIKSGAPPGDPSDPVNSTVSVELQRVGLYPGDVTITADAKIGNVIAQGVSVTPTSSTLTGLDEISTTLQISVDSTAADGDVVIAVHASRDGGATVDSSATITLRVDRHRPTIQSFTAALLGNVQLANAQPVTLSWSGDDGGGTVARYDIQRQIGSSNWTSFSLSSPTATSSVRLVALKTDYRFRVRAVDTVGNTSGWTVLNLRIGVRDSGNAAILYTADNSWTTRNNQAANGGSFRRSTTPGAFAATSFNGQGVAWVAPVGPGKGSATVSIDGTVVATVNLNAAQRKARKIVWASGPLAPGHHSLVIRVVGGIVDLDAILILK